ncbi:uncharacterized protein LACBIDRAFT_329062 [Laccaria bicolor S238N-H82]|uniref:Predicted protein n=1 Tax=Laccaria bicolor (strain S238N-H82 / ATCC MYA-4686) TaxID=486041 RepID=B0DGX9_LACBS|nr:uncharacterized protein LACBIDRAFT_329062 [Laccaria bicolor S238N-H82]EDR06227.1 predicted protein [Laccaria bicolor S238N-H82]|eukprot:XP_001883088.1 predicted protein [Laccaria bicolor S238N-H82]
MVNMIPKLSWKMLEVLEWLIWISKSGFICYIPFTTCCSLEIFWLQIALFVMMSLPSSLRVVGTASGYLVHQHKHKTLSSSIVGGYGGEFYPVGMWGGFVPTGCDLGYMGRRVKVTKCICERWCFFVQALGRDIGWAVFSQVGTQIDVRTMIWTPTLHPNFALQLTSQLCIVELNMTKPKLTNFVPNFHASWGQSGDQSWAQGGLL